MIVNIGGDNSWKESPLRQICAGLGIAVVDVGESFYGKFLQLYMPVLPENDVERDNKLHVIGEALRPYL